MVDRSCASRRVRTSVVAVALVTMVTACGPERLYTYRVASRGPVSGATVIARIDTATLEVTAQAEPNGSISIVGDQILASQFGEANADGTMDGPTVVAFDPVTLTTTPQAERPDR